MTLSLGLPGVRRDPSEAPSTIGRPVSDALLDQFGREARDLRISVTEKCSLRCTYCMPEQGLPAIPREQLLTPAEIARLVGIAVRDLGVRDIRFTGGEPLMRADLEEIVRLSSEAVSVGVSTGSTTAVSITGVSISMTTNGIGLDKRIEAAKRAGIAPLKINAVLMRDTLAGAADLLEWSLNNGARLRFIEQMPLDADE
ncbi:MAG: radical SAM protein, partial [Rhodoglobus sp.]|nr:radical SAM protein [Rhodoglobus sp.]